MQTHWIAQLLGIFPDWFWILLAAHAVNSFPTPGNKYGQWALGVVKFIVGQRVTGLNAINGYQSEVTAVTNMQKAQLDNGSSMQVVKTPVGVLQPVQTEMEKR